MIDIKIFFKGFGKLLLVLLTIAVSLYLLLWAINLQDEAPSAQSEQLQQILLAQESVPEQDNGFIYYTKHHAQPLNLPETLQALLQCQPEQCLIELQAAQATLPAQLTQQQDVLNSYQKLLAFPAWQSPVLEVSTEPVALRPLSEMQQLFLLDVWLKTQSGELATAKAMLQQDVSFWRKRLVTSNNPLDKLLVVAGVSRHFSFAEMLKQTLPAEQYQQLMPDLWLQPLTADESSLLLAMAGEWNFANSAVATVVQANPEEHSLLDRWSTSLIWRPFLKLQAVSNAFARLHLACAEQKSADVSETYPWYRWLYNPMGKILTQVSGTESCMKQHKALADLEQQRQALSAAAEGM